MTKEICILHILFFLEDIKFLKDNSEIKLFEEIEESIEKDIKENT